MSYQSCERSKKTSLLTNRPIAAMEVPKDEKGERAASRGGANGGRRRLTAAEKIPSIPSQSDALRKCLEENRGDKAKCKTKIDAFMAGSSADPETKPLPFRLRGGSLTDV